MSPAEEKIVELTGDVRSDIDPMAENAMIDNEILDSFDTAQFPREDLLRRHEAPRQGEEHRRRAARPLRRVRGAVFHKDRADDRHRQGGSFDRSLYTPRELEIIEAVASGLFNREIAEKLFISEGTVKNYISNILDKEGLSHRTQLAVYYLTGRKGV